ncbi:MAG: B12-binding domain-containing radical SAM protein [Nanoarchaeota archaeon]|nr:B12-binding domain-containing radical SAM protein [Nanoarchaeota archaeon]MBU1134892.1 B12-binding domain-containing radical SAM protein [Nanoarchaeota archaeon]MBU2520394.1 B12-binding domain-containing radical SAM protein [Nanoarchaeota archaeon]
MSDILLISPPNGIPATEHISISKNGKFTKSLPLGLGYIASSLKDSGYDVEVVDFNAENLSYDDVYQFLDGVRYVGATSITANVNNVLKIFENVKNYDGSIKTLIGGPHATSEPEETASMPYVDIVVVGEGEETAKQILDGKPLDRIEGISYKGNGGVVLNEGKGKIDDLNDLPFIDYSLFSFQAYRPSEHRNLGHGINEPYYATMISRGCPFECGFCSTTHDEVRRKNPDKVFSEIEYNTRLLGTDKVMFYDDVFTLDRNYLEEVCRILDKLNLTWGCNTRVDVVNREILEMMQDCGCKRVYIGAESGDDGILKSIDKKLTTDNILSFSELAKDIGLEFSASYILGLPGETRKTIQKTIDFSKRVDADFSQFYIFAPDPGSKINKQMKSNGIIEPFDWLDYKNMTRKITMCLGEEIEFTELVDILNGLNMG